MKNILLLLHDDDGQEARLQAALDVVRAVGGHLCCLDVVPLPAVLGTDYVAVSSAAALLADETLTEQTNRTRLEARLAAEDLPWDWTDTTGDVAERLEHAARLADLIVVNRQLSSLPFPDMRAVAGEVVIRSRRPVLAVPPGLERLDLSAAMVAWNGGEASAAALRAAVPLLSLAERVVVVEIDDGSVEQPAEDAAIYLSRHGISARVERRGALDAGTSRTIIDLAGRHGAGLLIAGGYGRTRLAEAMFGGVTRDLLTWCPTPLFMAH